MKIALIRKNYSPYGGAENYMSLVSKGLQAQGHEVHIFSSDAWPEGRYITHKVQSIRKPSFLSHMLFANNLRKELKKDSFDCVLSFERVIFGDIHPVGKKAQTEFSNGVYRAGDGCHREWLKKRAMVEPVLKRLSFSLNPLHLVLLNLEKKCFLSSRVIIANSNMVKKDIMRHYRVPEEKITVIYNGIDLRRFQPVPREQKNVLKESFGVFGIRKKEKVILFAGADFKRKGLDTLLKAFSMMDTSDVKLLVAGRAIEPQYLSMVKSLGISRKTIFWGSEYKIERLYAIADVFVLPTIYDPFSNAALEAMASGLPVVTTSYNGASELIENGVHGYVIDNPLDAGAFAGRISDSLKQVEKMGGNARIRAEAHSIEQAINSIIGVISETG
ncbi:MAG TPA: glycosyltransferase family 1 protein [Nitrospirae bacterium]|nr:spore coat protein SA [bacterium BMS3Abin10]GBE39241.1 spore coat protein SA [bacterium BMS3Bbin08]HDH50788.1 glycosyltransferase family 1 protein [Nitrospirota bacterium]HDK81550.1 glycosyltransferase family 1 protein [Nitrospirota bacterium]HDO25009.1 glycosyltransferase family 1 protein [Nitrospirota bacterium]